ncbi:MAG: hypothetical protein ACI4M9_06290 [Succinivibrio sp.]
MIALHCNQALIEFVKEAVADFRLSSPPRQTERRPGSLFEDNYTPEFKEEPKNLTEIAVHDGWLPNKDAATPDDYPFVTVRPSEATVTNGITQLTIEIVVGTFSRDENAYHDTSNVAQRILMRLAQLKDNLLAHKYERVGSMKWSMPFEQEQPFFMIVLTTNWHIYSSQFDSSI